MKSASKSHGLTRKDIVAATNCPPYLVAYYSQCGYLPILRPSTGSGNPILYDPRATDVIRERMARQQPQAAELKTDD